MNKYNIGDKVVLNLNEMSKSTLYINFNKSGVTGGEVMYFSYSPSMGYLYSLDTTGFIIEEKMLESGYEF